MPYNSLGTTALRAQFSQMTEFFCNVSSLINDVMRPQVTSWVKNIEANSKMVLAGVSLSGARSLRQSVRLR